jgi:hypothetical protein
VEPAAPVHKGLNALAGAGTDANVRKMTRLMPLLALAIPIALAACEDESSDDVGSCPAGELTGYVGQPESATDEIAYDGIVRVIQPGMVITMDFNPDRLNFEIGEDGRIARIYCG